MNTTIPLSLYIHIPWCVRKCPYCDFNSHQLKTELAEEQYIERLMEDLDENLPTIWGRRLTSIFFGGGTPSLFSPAAIEKILQGVQSRLRFISPNIEITLEANPGTIDEPRFKGFRAAGVNRLSIGIQSLQNQKLQALGRIHNREYALRAIEACINSGFDSFNLDLMHGLPQQSLEDAMADLNDALEFDPPHLSWYQLTIEPNTLFYKQPPVLPRENTLWDIQIEGINRLTSAGLNQYEVSAFAKENHECIHNKNYWEFGDYLGIGAGAHSKITDASTGQITRHAQVKHPKDYLDKTKTLTQHKNILTSSDLIFEFMLNALRLKQGVSTQLFTERTGLPIDVLDLRLTIAIEKKLLTEDPYLLKPTQHGAKFLNDLIEIFL